MDSGPQKGAVAPTLDSGVATGEVQLDRRLEGRNPGQVAGHPWLVVT